MPVHFSWSGIFKSNYSYKANGVQLWAKLKILYLSYRGSQTECQEKLVSGWGKIRNFCSRGEVAENWFQGKKKRKKRKRSFLSFLVHFIFVIRLLHRWRRIIYHSFVSFFSFPFLSFLFDCNFVVVWG